RTSRRQPSRRDVAVDLQTGEILGIAGLGGAKRTDSVETRVGIREKASGTSTRHGTKLTHPRATAARNPGCALVPA
ncbi:sugar ABC transporter ATP-binding protein, partial [Klebsiella pneumoniae]|nr:sugar ABC transporter ATP-binding protein [Klebsiella pneumoniae]